MSKKYRDIIEVILVFIVIILSAAGLFTGNLPANLAGFLVVVALALFESESAIEEIVKHKY